MYKYKLKEIEVGDTKIRKGVKSTVTDIDPETGAISWDVADAADFSSTYKALKKAKDFLDTLEKTGKAKDDTAIDQFSEEIANLFNAFRTHVRKNYPKEYERVSRLKEGTFHGPREIAIYDGPDGETYIEKRGTGYYGYNNKFDFTAEDKAELKHKLNSWRYRLVAGSIDEQSSTATGGDAFAGGEGAQYATPFAFRKKGKKSPSIYYYKLGYKPVPKIKPKSYDIKKLFEYNDFQENRIKAFDDIEKTIETILPMLSNAKNRTAEYYNENPGSYGIKYPTDAILTELNDIIEQIKAGNEDISQSI